MELVRKIWTDVRIWITTNVVSLFLFFFAFTIFAVAASFGGEYAEYVWIPIALFMLLLFGNLYMSTPNSDVHTNDDEVATKNFLCQIEKTKKNIRIFDDGNFMQNSIYNKDEVIKKLEEKVKGENSRFRLEIHFNDEKGSGKKGVLAIYDLASKYPERISIKDDLQNCVSIKGGLKIRGDGFHFKISDFGKYCYVSKHKKGDKSRKYLEYEKKWFQSMHPVVRDCNKTFAEQSRSNKLSDN